MAQYARKDASIATVSAWSNRGELASFPRPGEDNPVPEFPEAIAEAAAAAPWGAAAGTADRRRPRRAAAPRCARPAWRPGHDSFAGEHALDDFCRRAAAMGWRNILCPAAYLVRQPAAGPTLLADELGPLVARWPDYQEQVARFILADPLRSLRERLLARMDELARGGPQRDLFH